MKAYLNSVLFLISLALFPGLVSGQSDFPNRPITLVNPMVAGAATDISARLIAKVAEKYFGHPVVVVNKTGGGGTVGTAAVAAAKPDGYTVGCLLTTPMMAIPHLEKLTYHPVKDLEPIIQYSILNFAISVRDDSPYKTFKEVIEYARKHPGVVTYATSGVNNAQHIIMEAIAREEKVEWIHVPFKGGAESLIAVTGGHVSLAAGDISFSLVKAKKLRLLVMFLEERSSEFPDIPTLKELGYKAPIPYFMGLGGPKGIPEPIMTKLEDTFTKAFRDPEFSSGMKTSNLLLSYRNRKDFGDYIARNFEQTGKAIQEMKKK